MKQTIPVLRSVTAGRGNDAVTFWWHLQVQIWKWLLLHPRKWSEDVGTEMDKKVGMAAFFHPIPCMTTCTVPTFYNLATTSTVSQS